MLFLSCRTGLHFCLDTKTKQKDQDWKSFYNKTTDQEIPRDTNSCRFNRHSNSVAYQSLPFFLPLFCKQKYFRSVLNMIAVRFNRKYKYSSSNIQTPQRGEMLVAPGGMKWNPGLMSEANKRRNRPVQHGGNVACTAIMCRVSMLFLSCRTGFTLCLDTKSKQKNPRLTTSVGQEGWKSFWNKTTGQDCHVA